MKDFLISWAGNTALLVGGFLSILLGMAWAFYSFVGWLISILLLTAPEIPWYWGVGALVLWAVCVALFMTLNED